MKKKKKNLKVEVVAGLGKDTKSKNISVNKKLQNLIAGFFLSAIESFWCFLPLLVKQKFQTFSNSNVLGIFVYFLKRKMQRPWHSEFLSFS